MNRHPIVCSAPAFFGLRAAVALGLVPLALVLEAGTVQAADGAADGGQLGPVVVTSTRTEKPADEAPVRTEVIDRQEIEATKARTLKEALENVPGLTLQEVRGKSGYQLSLQGFGSDQVLVLIDGLPISPSTGSTVDLSQYLLADVDRVEVVKGAASAQYGSSAMGGVVNVITRPIQPGIGGRLSGEVGTRQRQNASGRSADAAIRVVQGQVEGGGETLRGRLSVERLGDDGFAVNPAGWSRQGDEISRQQVAGRLEWRPRVGRDFWLEASRYEEDDLQRYTVLAPPLRVPQHKHETIDRDRVSGGARWRLAQGGGLDLRGVAETYDSTSLALSNGALANDRRSSQRMGHLSLQYDAPVWRSQFWQFGADLHGETLTQTNNGLSELGLINRARRSSRELYVQNDAFVTDRWEVVPGVRWQDDSDFGGHWAPKVAVRGRLIEDPDNALTVRASVGRGYRVPNLKERHYLFDHSSLGYIVIGNPDLRPESSTSFQLGLSWATGRRFTVDVNLYHNRVRDLIQVDEANAVSVINGVASYRYENVARARTEGIETALTWRPANTLTLGAAATFARSRDLATGDELTRRPARVLRLSADWRATEWTTFNTRIRAQGNELVNSATGGRSPSWTVVDLRLTHRITPDLAVWFGIDNLTDRQRQFANPDDFGPLAGRTIRLGIQSAFGNASPL